MNFLLLPILLVSLAEPPPCILKLDLEAQPSSLAGEVELVISDPTKGAEVLRRKLPFPWHGEVELDHRASDLRLEIASEQFWAPPVSLTNLQIGESLRIELFPRGEISFAESPAVAREKAALPVPVAVDVASVPTSPGKSQLPRVPLTCRFAEERWRCPAPAIDLDLRLEKAQHVPVYLWGAKVEAGKTLDLGAFRFVRGASISGYVTVEEGEPRGVTVAVAFSGPSGLRDGQRGAFRKLTTTANERGFFQLLGVGPGGFRLEASRAGLSPAELFPVDVAEGTETVLSEPLLLSRLAVVELHLSPPLDPLGKRWKLLLSRLREDEAADPLEATAEEDGSWTGSGLQRGRYFLNVLSADGEATGSGSDSIWVSLDLDLEAESPPVFLDLPVVAVRGTLRAGERRIQGRLIFGGYFGAPHVTIRADEEGNFTGSLPRDGEWSLDAEIDGQRRTLPPVIVKPLAGLPARLDIQLPDTRFHGRVTHRGKPVTGADLAGVRTAEPGKIAQFSIKSDEEGSFELKGADPGTYYLTASHAGLRLGAPKLEVEIREGGNEPVEIELEEFQRIEGQIVAAGQGVPGARFRAELRARKGQDLRSGFTDAAGVVGLVVPQSTSSMSLLVAARGFAWTLTELRPRISGEGFDPFVLELSQDGASLELNGPPGELRLYHDGAELPLQSLQGALQGSGYFEQRADSILLHNAAPGFYRLCSGKGCAEGIAAPGGNLRLQLALEAAIKSY